MSKKVLITGGAGFIGSHLSERLVQDGFTVRVLDDFSTGDARNLSSVHDQVEIIRGDIRDWEVTKRAVEGAEVVFHQAAARAVLRSVDDPKGTNSINVDGTLNVLLAARDAGVRRLVHASSSSVYGDAPTLPKQEGMTPAPVSPYAVSKLAAEHYCRVFYRLYGLETICLRYFNVFGPRQDPTSQYAAVIPRFVDSLMHRQPPVIHGDGAQSRDFTYVENVVEANLRAMETQQGIGEPFNIACGQRLRIDELARTLMERLEVELEPQHSEPRPGDVLHTLADISRAKELLGYEPVVGVEEGLGRTVAWYLDDGVLGAQGSGGSRLSNGKRVSSDSH